MGGVAGTACERPGGGCSGGSRAQPPPLKAEIIDTRREGFQSQSEEALRARVVELEGVIYRMATSLQTGLNDNPDATPATGQTFGGKHYMPDGVLASRLSVVEDLIRDLIRQERSVTGQTVVGSSAAAGLSSVGGEDKRGGNLCQVKASPGLAVVELGGGYLPSGTVSERARTRSGGLERWLWKFGVDGQGFRGSSGWVGDEGYCRISESGDLHEAKRYDARLLPVSPGPLCEAVEDGTETMESSALLLASGRSYGEVSSGERENSEIGAAAGMREAHQEIGESKGKQAAFARSVSAKKPLFRGSTNLLDKIKKAAEDSWESTGAATQTLTFRRRRQKKEQDAARASAEGAELTSAGIPGVKVAAPTGVRSKGTTVRNLQEEYQMKHNTLSISSKPDEGVGEHAVRVLRQFVWDPIHPNQGWRVSWDGIILLLCTWVCIYVPLVICFTDSANPVLDEDAKNSDGVLGSWVQWMDVAVDVLFLLDIAIQFRTAYYVGDTLVTSHLGIARHYITTWFLVDVLALNPVGYVTTFLRDHGTSVSESLRLLELTQLLKIAKLARLLRIPQLTKFFEERLGWALTRLIMFVAAAFCLLHLSACTFHYVAVLQYEDNPDASTWVGEYVGYDASIAVRYITALYWAISTMSTVGYGDVTAVSPVEKVMSCLQMLMGVAMFSYFMSSMAALGAMLNSSTARLAAKRQAVDDFISQHKLPKELSDRIRQYKNYVVHREFSAEQQEIVHGLSSTLQTEVLLFLHQDIISKVPFFSDKSPQFMAHLVQHFQLEFYAPYDVIFQEGDKSNEMYFIGEGQLGVWMLSEESNNERGKGPKRSQQLMMMGAAAVREVLGAAEPHIPSENLKRSGRLRDASVDDPVYLKIGELEAGQYFGEYSCLTGETRTATVVALQFSELYSLSKATLDNMIDTWPHMAVELYNMVEDISRSTGSEMGVLNEELESPTDGAPKVKFDRRRVSLDVTQATPSVVSLPGTPMPGLDGRPRMRSSYTATTPTSPCIKASGSSHGQRRLSFAESITHSFARTLSGKGRERATSAPSESSRRTSQGSQRSGARLTGVAEHARFQMESQRASLGPKTEGSGTSQSSENSPERPVAEDEIEVPAAVGKGKSMFSL